MTYNPETKSSQQKLPNFPNSQIKSSLEDLDKASEWNSLAETPEHFLSSLEEFMLIPKEELRTLAKMCRFKSIKNKEYLINEGEEEKSYGYVVVSGCLAMTKTSISGKELIVELLQKGDVFGLILMLTAEKNVAQLSARAVQPSNLLLVPIDGFRSLLDKYPALYEAHVVHLLLCLQSAYQLSRGLAHDKVDVRIASILLSLMIKFPNRDKNVDPIVNFTREQLADLTGTTTETAIRITKSMESQSILTFQGPGKIQINNIPALEKIAEY